MPRNDDSFCLSKRHSGKGLYFVFPWSCCSSALFFLIVIVSLLLILDLLPDRLTRLADISAFGGGKLDRQPYKYRTGQPVDHHLSLRGVLEPVPQSARKERDTPEYEQSGQNEHRPENR